MSLFSVFVIGGSLGAIVGCVLVLTIFTLPTIIRQQRSIETLLHELVEIQHQQALDRWHQQGIDR